MIVFHRGGGFYLDHPPSALVTLALRQHHVGKRQRARALQAGLKKRLRRVREQLRRAGKRRGIPLPFHIDHIAPVLRIVDLPRYVADRIADLETRQRSGRVLTQLRPMDFEPQALRTLAKRDEFRFGEIAHKESGDCAGDGFSRGLRPLPNHWQQSRGRSPLKAHGDRSEPRVT